MRSPKNEGVRIDLPYGSHPYPLDLAGRDATVLSPASLADPPPVEVLLDRALDESPLPHVAPGARVTVIVSDPTRNEPRAALLGAIQVLTAAACGAISALFARETPLPMTIGLAACAVTSWMIAWWVLRLPQQQAQMPAYHS